MFMDENEKYKGSGFQSENGNITTRYKVDFFMQFALCL